MHTVDSDDGETHNDVQEGIGTKLILYIMATPAELVDMARLDISSISRTVQLNPLGIKTSLSSHLLQGMSTRRLLKEIFIACHGVP